MFSCPSSELTSGDGTCLPLSAKCDGLSDCKDELDERDCRVVEFSTDRQYKESLPPVGKKKDGQLAPTQVRNRLRDWLFYSAPVSRLM